MERWIPEKQPLNPGRRVDADTALARCQDLLAAARKNGADAADAVARASLAEGIGVRLGALEDVERSESEELHLRVFVGRRSASIASSDFSPASIAALAQRAVEMARLAPEDAFAGLDVAGTRHAVTLVGQRTYAFRRGTVEPSQPAPLGATPLRWDHAYGGTDSSDPRDPVSLPENPIGRGFARDAPRHYLDGPCLG